MWAGNPDADPSERSPVVNVRWEMRSEGASGRFAIRLKREDRPNFGLPTCSRLPFKEIDQGDLDQFFLRRAFVQRELLQAAENVLVDPE